jgi:DNA-binding transcriptional LysR family regulator
MEPAQLVRDFNLQNAHTFVRVVESGGISAAARQLGIAKSVVSARMAALETSLGTTLFNRGRRLTLTRRGQEFHAGLKLILDDLDQLVFRTANHNAHSHLSGRIKIAVPAGFGGRYLGGIICAFLASNPDLRAEMDFSDSYVDIAHDNYDLALRIGQPKDSGLVGRRLCQVRRVVCASPHYLKEHGVPETIDELALHRGIAYSLVQSTGQWIFAGGPGTKRRAAKPPQVVVFTNSGEGMRDAVLAGLGIGILPSFFIAEDLLAGRIRALGLDREPLAAELWALHSRRQEGRPIVRALTTWLADRLRDPPFWEVGL